MRLFRRMMREEWRMHSTVFGGVKFALFPFLILGMSLGIFSILPRLGFTPVEIQFGMHFLVLFLGMNVGGIGFVSRSGMRNVLQDFNLLLFSSRTLPLSRSRILLTFVAKDMVYYFFYFLLPLSIGTLALSASAESFLLASLSYALAFALGVSSVFLLSTVYARTRKSVFFPAAAALALGYYLSPLSLEALNPAYVFYLAPSTASFALSLVPPLLLLCLGVKLFGYDTRRRPRKSRDLYSWFRRRLSPLNSKNMLDVHRSSGGFGKILVSFGVLFAVFWFLVSWFPLGRLFLKAPLLSFASLLGMASASVYNWLNRFDSIRGYLHLPLVEGDLLRSKVGSFALMGLPLIALGDFAAFLLLEAPAAQLLHAVLISSTSAFFLLSVMVHLTGLEPNTMMFDFTVMLKFLVYSSLLVVPYLVLSMLYVQLPSQSSAALLTLYLVSSAVSYLVLSKEYRA
ncbi:MAG: hypothetical protein SVQ76_02740 [Candidatus Nanohaloarchaea archaeon]|nr:hypothetical protein [Candidatus Nanohaloarchaea archaeon]